MTETTHKVIDSSLRTVLSVSLPLILSALSNNLLLLIDRMILAYYSVDSMNAASISGNFVAIFSLMFVSITGVAEIYVGQSNGRKRYTELATPIWQMIYFSLIGGLIIAPLGFFIEYINMVPDYCLKEALEYQRIFIFCSFLPGIKIAFASFFIGQGKTKIITFTVIVGSLLDIFLDIAFIFGYGKVIPEMGCFGAALATVLSEAFQILILATVFFNKRNRTIYKTLKQRKFNSEIFKGCLRIGTPMAIGRIFELIAWYLVYVILSYVSRDLAIIQGICVSVYMLFAFVCEGISKSAATISANLIGQRDFESIRKVLKIFVWIILAITVILLLPLTIFPQVMFHFFDSMHDNISHLYPQISTILRLTIGVVALEATSCAFWGILVSGGDTRYPMIANIVFLWSIVVIPSAILYHMRLLHSATVIYVLDVIMQLIVCIIFYKRYKTSKWYRTL